MQIHPTKDDAFAAGHRRLYEHLCSTTEHRPETLAGLQPLYQAVAHGCLAGMQQQACVDVYRDRILRGTGHGGFYSSKKLGAIGADLGAVACFFDRPWTRLSPNLSAAAQAWLLNEAASRLRALGRLNEAVEPMRTVLDRDIEQEEWKFAAISAGNLSELELTLGDVRTAVADAEQSVEFADRSKDAVERMINRATLADALHQAGKMKEEGGRMKDESPEMEQAHNSSFILPPSSLPFILPPSSLFREAEKMQAERQPEYSRLYSVQGFRYCDLLLSGAERAAWRVTMASGGRQPTDSATELAIDVSATESADSRPSLAEICDNVTERATQTLEWVTPQNWLLDIALDHLTLGRAGLYEAVLSKSEISNQQSEIQSHLTAAVDGLRQSGNMDDLPRGLLTRAWFLAWRGDAAGAAADLDEAWEIAERGPMPLFQADILLTDARLRIADQISRHALASGSPAAESRTVPEPGASALRLMSPAAALAEARRLIDEHGYHRRDGELEDAEQALQRLG